MNRSSQKRTMRAGVLLSALAAFLVIVAFFSAMASVTPATSSGASGSNVRSQPAVFYAGQRLLANPVQAAALVTRTVGFEDNALSVIEGNDFVIEVSISGKPDRLVSVGYESLDGTGNDPAIANVDYRPVRSEIEWLPEDQNSKIIRVDTFNRSGYQGDRRFSVILQDADGVTINPLGDEITLIILDDESPPQATPTRVFVDRFEPNNALLAASQVSVGVNECNITLWPSGDFDYFSFFAKQGFTYSVKTTSGSTGSNLDTELTVYGTNGNGLGQNDDFGGTRFSQVTFDASINGIYYARVVNKNPADSANQFYCFQVTEVARPTSTPAPTSTRVPGADGCEPNGGFESACLIGAGETLNLNFVPLQGQGPDNDFFRLWVKPGLFYECETFDLSPVNDTNMILYDQNRNGLGGNDDKAIGDFGSQVGYLSTYTGWLYILVGPVTTVDYANSFLFTYSLQCAETVATPTATPTNTAVPFTGGVVPRPPTATPLVATATVTPFTTVEVPPTPQPTATPNIQIIPLPTNTPPPAAQRTINIELTVYYDSNMNYTAELTEGVEDVAVAIYDNMTNELLAFGYTNEAGAIRFSALSAMGPVRISIPFLQYSQTTNADTNTFIRIAPYVQRVGPS